MFRRLLERVSERFSGFKFSRFKKGIPLKDWLIILKSLRPAILDSFSKMRLFLKKIPKIELKQVPNYLKSFKFHKRRLAILIFATFLIIITAVWILIIHPKLYHLNVKKTVLIYIRSDSKYEQVLEDLKSREVLENINTFNWLAKKRDYPSRIKPGAYKIEEGWSNKQILEVLISGIQTPVKVTFHNLRFRENLAARLARCFESDSTSFLLWLKNDSLAKAMGFTYESFPGLFIPNTYEFYWTTSPKKFIERMKKEYDIFWNDARKTKAKNLDLTIGEVITLASIVQEETIKEDEKSKIARVYINRLQRNWHLQADPTVKFALADFSIKRILHKYTDIDSPYNTYKYKGLPPGPINFPEIQSIDAVLNAEKTDYMYFCAKDDFSGYHQFSKTLSEHLKYARSYQQALNRNKILK